MRCVSRMVNTQIAQMITLVRARKKNIGGKEREARNKLTPCKGINFGRVDSRRRLEEKENKNGGKSSEVLSLFRCFSGENYRLPRVVCLPFLFPGVIHTVRRKREREEKAIPDEEAAKRVLRHLQKRPTTSALQSISRSSPIRSRVLQLKP